MVSITASNSTSGLLEPVDCGQALAFVTRKWQWVKGLGEVRRERDNARAQHEPGTGECLVFLPSFH
jgi:hypothetical protein